MHHIKPRIEGGSDHPSNLVTLCPNCHALIHAGLASINHRRVFTDLREARRAEAIDWAEEWGE